MCGTDRGCKESPGPMEWGTWRTNEAPTVMKSVRACWMYANCSSTESALLSLVLDVEFVDIRFETMGGKR